MKKITFLLLSSFFIFNQSTASVVLENIAEDKFKYQQIENNIAIEAINKEIKEILNFDISEYYVNEIEVNRFIDQYHKDFLNIANESFKFYDREKEKLFNIEEREIRFLERDISIIDRRLETNCKIHSENSFCKRQNQERELSLNKITTKKHTILEIDLFLEKQKLDNLHKLKKEAFIDRVNDLIEKYKIFEKQRTNQEP